MTAPHLDASRRQDFVLLYDVTDGNPNGDPDAGNLPRLDPETMQGLMTDVAIKRKIRDWVALTKKGEDGYAIYVQNETALNTLHQEGRNAAAIKEKNPKVLRPDDRDPVQHAMTRRFFDIRTFGAVMSTGVNAGQVRGPVQLTFGRSIDPIVPLDISITRIAITRPEDRVVEAVDEQTEQAGKQTEMGRKAIVPYGLYRTHGFVNPLFAEQTGFGSDDLAVLWDALARMWEIDRSAARGFMACRGIHVFSHTSKWGDAPAHRLFERVRVSRVNESVPRSFSDYRTEVDSRGLLEAVTYTDLTP